MNIASHFAKYDIQIHPEEKVVLDVMQALYIFLKIHRPESFLKQEKMVKLDVDPSLLARFDSNLPMDEFIGCCFSLCSQTLSINRQGSIIYDKLFSLRTDGTDEHIILCFNVSTLVAVMDGLEPCCLTADLESALSLAVG